MSVDISSLAFETLQEIFSHAHTVSVPDLNSRQVKENEHLAVTMSHVCRRWRDAALGYPVLWTYINRREESSASALRVDSHIERSAGRLLTFSFVRDTSDTPLDQDNLDVIQKCMSRAAYVIIEDAVAPQDIVPIALGMHAPHLRSLRFHFYFPVIGVREPSHNTISASATSYNVDVVVFKDSSPVNAVALPRPTTMRSILIPLADTLTTLTVEYNLLYMHSAPILLPRLRSLTTEAPHIPGAFNAPSLEHLALREFSNARMDVFFFVLQRTWAHSPMMMVKNVMIKMLGGDVASDRNYDFSALFVAFPCVECLHLDITPVAHTADWYSALCFETWAELRCVVVKNTEARDVLVDNQESWSAEDIQRIRIVVAT